MTPEKSLKYPLTMALIGNYLPRQCGIATFTYDLLTSISKEMASNENIFALAMNDFQNSYHYPSEVRFEIRENIQDDYAKAADFLNINEIDVVVLQHEYGIFGGASGNFILSLANKLKMPLLTTLHTVLDRPSKEQYAVMKDLVNFSDKLIVLNPMARQMLIQIYRAPEDKIVHIPHGIPNVPFLSSSRYKKLFNLEGRKIILTFGLISPGKGIEQMIQAMPEIVKRLPDALYIVLGATHPKVLRNKGEEYRDGLERIARELGVEKNILFRNKFVTLEELCNYLGATDVYVIPYPTPERMVSGSLAYAMGTGKAIVSTPYWHAKELLSDGSGVLVPFNNPSAMSQTICSLLENGKERTAMARRAYKKSRHMLWSQIGRKYLETAKEVIARQSRCSRQFHVNFSSIKKLDKLPVPDLTHLRNMTDDTGMLQHALFATPHRLHGYCVDDTSRALIAAILYWEKFRDKSVIPLIHNYLAFIAFSFNKENKRFRNFMSYDRKWLEDCGSEDSHGRALWSLGFAVANAPSEAIRNTSAHLFHDALTETISFKYIRAWAMCLIGMHAYLAYFSGDAKVRNLREILANYLLESFETNATADWPWCEDTVTYANAHIPHALLLSGQWVPDNKMIDHGLASLEWLLRVQTGGDGQISLIGNDGWLKKGASKANFDQQPVEIMALVQACVEAFNLTGNISWLEESHRCLDWFLGRNDLREPVYDFKTGGSYDGLTPRGTNRHQGAESTLAWLISLLTVHNQEKFQNKETFIMPNFSQGNISC